MIRKSIPLTFISLVQNLFRAQGLGSNAPSVLPLYSLYIIPVSMSLFRLFLFDAFATLTIPLPFNFMSCLVFHSSSPEPFTLYVSRTPLKEPAVGLNPKAEALNPIYFHIPLCNPHKPSLNPKPITTLNFALV